MPADDYAAAPSTGKLKLKGITEGRIDKKKKKKKKQSKTEATDHESVPDAAGEDKDRSGDNSVMLKRLEDEDGQITKDNRREVSIVDGTRVQPGANEPDLDVRAQLQTEAQRKFEEQRRKRLEERLKREGVKTHKQRVEELNKYLSGLSEHHDMPKIGPG